MLKMLNLIKLGIIGFLISFFYSCAGPWQKSVVKGNGNIVEIERSVENYQSISLSGWFDIEIVDGNEGNLLLTGEENLLDYIVTEVRNDRLYLEIENGYQLKPVNLSEGIKVKVPVESINEIVMSGSGDVTVKKVIEVKEFKSNMSGSGNLSLNLQAEKFLASVSGSGNMQLSGKTRVFKIMASGSSHINAFNLETEEANATLSGSGNIMLTPLNKLKAQLSGSGSIRYRGNPQQADIKSSGSGSIKKEST